MSRGFIKEGDQEEIPMVPPRAYLPKGMPNYVTKEGLEALKRELQGLEDERIKAGDNYIMSNFIDAKMKLLIARINSAVEVDLSKAKKGIVSFGAYVRYNGRTVRIVGVDEADFSKGLLSFVSPVAKALVGKKVGDVFEVKVPKGTEIIEIKEVTFEKTELTVEELPRISKDLIVESRAKKEVVRQQTVIENEIPVKGEEKKSEQKKDFFVPEEDIMEFLPVVNERGNIVGRALQMELHKGNKILHPVVHLHVNNSKGVNVGKYWWHVAFGDAPEKTLKRKAAETLGLTAIHVKLKKQYIRETKAEKELVYVYHVISDEEIIKSPEGNEYAAIFGRD